MIDPGFQSKLMAALHNAVQHFNSGMSPTDAVTKSADDARFNVDQTQRLVESFNTARTIYHFDKAATPATKSDAFELCDGDAVILNLFKHPEIRKAASADYAFYRMAPARSDVGLTDDLGTARYEKAAAADIDMDSQFGMIQSRLKLLADAADEALSTADMFKFDADRTIQKMAFALGTFFEDVATNKLHRLYFGLPDVYAPVLQKLAGVLPPGVVFNPDTRNDYPLVLDTRDIVELMKMAASAKSSLEHSAELRASVEMLRKDAESYTEQRDALLGNTSRRDQESPADFFTPELCVKSAFKSPSGLPPFNGPGDVSGGGGGKGKSSGGSSDSGGAMGGAWSALGAVHGEANSLSKQLPGAGAISGPLEEFSSQLSAPIMDVMLGADDIKDDTKKMQDRMRNTQRSVILEDLLINDPVLSESEPKHIAQAYQMLVNIAPETSLRKEVARAILRQVSSSNLAASPFDANVWLDTEKRIRELAGTMPPTARKDIKS